MRSATACLTAFLLLAATPTAACSPPPGWPRKVRLDVPRVARVLVEAAATVDIVVAERATDDYEVATTPEANSEAMAAYGTGDDGLKLTAAEVSAKLKDDEVPDGARLHYRVVERLKGASLDTFSLNGMLVDGGGTKERRLSTINQLRSRLNSQDFADWQGFGACITPLWTQLGQRYVVFRDPDGKLLRQTVPMWFGGKVTKIQGPVYAEVDASGDDAWLKAIRQAVPASE